METRLLRIRNARDIRMLLQKRCASLDSRDDNGATALSLAAERGRVKVVNLLLLQKGIDPNSLDNEGRTPLSRAAESGNIQVVDLLIKNGKADPDLKDKKGWAPLHWAVNTLQASSYLRDHDPADYSVMKRLLEYTLEPNYRDSMGRTALSQAAEGGHMLVVKLLLLQEGIDPNSMDNEGRTPLSRAAESGHVTVVELLINEGAADPDLKDKMDRTPLQWAIIGSSYRGTYWRSTSRSLHREVVKLLSRRDDVNPESRDKEGRTSLSWAVECPHQASQLCQLLLERNRANPETKDNSGRTPLSRAVQIGHEPVVAALLKQTGVNADIKDDDGRTPLSRAAEYGHKSILELLLAQSYVEPDSKDNRGRTPLWWAAGAGSTESVQVLLKTERVDPVGKDDDGCTPLLQAVQNGHGHMIAKSMRKDRFILNILASNGDLVGLEALLENGHGVDTKDFCGRTPLHAAALSGRTDIAKELLCRKAAIDCRDNSGSTPLHLAMRSRREEIIHLLLEYSAGVTGIQSADWFDAFNQEASDVALELSQTLSGKVYLRFSRGQQIQRWNKPGLIRRMSIFADYYSWSKYCASDLDSSTQYERPQMFYKIEHHDGYKRISIIGFQPVKQSPQDHERLSILAWTECAIAWTITPSSYDQSCWESKDHFSMLPYGWIPEDGVAFFTLFIQHLNVSWHKFCTLADEHLSQRRLDQLRTRGTSIDMINCLAEDAREWATLRKALKSQVHAARDFVLKYCLCCNQAEHQRRMQLPINQFEADITEKINELDQTVKDLLQLELTWGSSNEAHKSASTSLSMKRLSWITFIFLPAMFTSSLFGMNVDILESNPDWRWYLLLSGACLTLTVVAWLLSKYCEIHYQSYNRFREWIEGLTRHRLSAQESTHCLLA